MKSGFVSIVGKPSVGKSTLLNSLVGAKVSIVSDKRQTTRNRINAIANLPDAQVVFIDTPGIHKPRHGLGERMVEAARGAMEGVDLILLVADATSPARADDRAAASYVADCAVPAWLIVNKRDLVDAEGLRRAEEACLALGDFKKVRAVSAATGENMDGLLREIADAMPEGPMYYPPDVVVDRPEEFLIAELIREKLLELTREEIPHSIAVVVEEMTPRDDKDIVDVRAAVYVERESQKGIVIGAGGRVLKEAGIRARLEAERLLGSQINLQTWVKVRRRWRDDQSILDRLGYSE
ncbi:MAG: GTPase Era [Bacillota bacterium]|nr:GTPase Era [Bacillota bacterium]NLH88109.1 GTPase Era [Bacillota bacterium]HAN87178.1 GTPase Era [Bacillota bacterium]